LQANLVHDVEPELQPLSTVCKIIAAVCESLAESLYPYIEFYACLSQFQQFKFARGAGHKYQSKW